MQNIEEYDLIEMTANGKVSAKAALRYVRITMVLTPGFANTMLYAASVLDQL
jgi:hypothetical protein